jgi:hypothetical protein
MADLVVRSDTRLDEFLRTNGVQQWRVPILAATGGVVVVRGKGGPRVRLEGAATRLQPKDVVTLVSPLPKACVAALQHEADNNWRDYAIAPGVDAAGAPPYNERMRKFLRVRSNTILIDTTAHPEMANLQGFLQGIATSESITHPIRDLIVAGHASGVSGSFRIALTPGAADTVTYEDLEEAVKHKTLIANVAFMQPRPAWASPPRLRLFGCAVGRVAPFMRKLKEALGSQLLVSAPNHLLIGAQFVARTGGSSFSGELAYLDYAFRLFLPPPQTPPGKKRPARKKKDLVDAFVAATKAEADAAKARKPAPAQIKASPPGEYMLYDRTYVTKTQWSAWVPPSPEDRRWFPPDPFRPTRGRDPHQIDNNVTLPVFKVRTNAPRMFEVHLARSWFKDPQTMPLAKDPGTDAGRKKAVKAWLQGIPFYKDNHPLPGYVRAGYKTMDEFMDGWAWQFAYNAKTKTLTYNPIRDEYAVVQPITDRLGVLMINYYTEKPPPKRPALKLPIELLQIDDRFLFTTY